MYLPILILSNLPRGQLLQKGHILLWKMLIIKILKMLLVGIRYPRQVSFLDFVSL